MPTKILAIDDSKTMRLAIKITFAAEDAEVTSVSKGGDAVARAKQAGADVVIVDHKLGAGDLSGYDVCKSLKGDSATAQIPVILLVSNQTGVDQGKLAESGADAWMAKPFDTQELIDKVAELAGAGAGKPAARPAATAAAAPPPAAKPLAPPPTAGPAVKPTPSRPVFTPAAKPAVASTGAKPAAAAKPSPAPTPRVTARTQIGVPTPVPKTVPLSGDGAIPIAIPIPFTAASAPTSSMLERLQAAAGNAGVDPKVAEAIANLSREVIERVVWEVVPELAESIIKKEAEARSA